MGIFERVLAQGSVDMSFTDRLSMGLDGGLWKLVIVVVIIIVIAYFVSANKKKKAAEALETELVEDEISE